MTRRIAVFAARAEVARPEELTAAHRIGLILGENAFTVRFAEPVAGPLATLVDTAERAGGRIERIAADQPDWGRVLVEGADAFVGLPGGFATLDAAFDVWQWAPDRLDQPLGLLDEGDYFSALLRTATDAVVDRFVQESQRGRLVVTRDAAELLRRLTAYRPPETRRDHPVFDDDD